MPTVLRVEGFRFFFFSNEMHEPPHVHVERGDGYAKIWLQPLSVCYSVGLHPSEMCRLREFTIQHWADLMEKWNEHLDQ